MDGELDQDVDIRDVVAHIGVADVREFGLSWEDCEEMLRRLGFVTEVRIQKAA